MKRLLTIWALLAVAAFQPATAADVPAGAYTLDKSHASLLFRVNHLGFSNYTARFDSFEAKLQFDPDNLTASRVEVTIDPRSIKADNAPPGFLNTLQGPQWLDAAKFPEMTFRSTQVDRRGPHSVRIHGDLTLHGVTQQIILDAIYNGGYAGHPMAPRARIGFSARGTFKRSDFGIAYGIPAHGSSMGVSDDVQVVIEAEFSGPPLRK